VAAWPLAETLDRIAALDRPAVPGVRWTTRDQWHVTLRFLGEVPDVAPVLAALAGLPALARVEAVLGPAVGRFDQRILHVPVEGLDGLAAEVLASTAHIGRPPQEASFSGHLTLARVKKGTKVDLRPLTGAAVAATWTVRDVSLVESRPSPAGARYRVMETFPLGSAPAGGPNR
jgi:2'-5' RNA ligase